MSTVPMQTADSRLELARRLFRECYSQYFWHCRPDLPITEARIPMAAKGLRTHGGRKGQLAAAYLSLGAVVWAACSKDEGYTPVVAADNVGYGNDPHLLMGRWQNVSGVVQVLEALRKERPQMTQIL